VPVVISGTGTGLVYTATGSYLKVGRSLWFTVSINVTANGTAASYLLINNMPFVALKSVVAAGRNDAGPMLQGLVGAGTAGCVIVRYDGLYPVGGAPCVLTLSGVYEV